MANLDTAHPVAQKLLPELLVTLGIAVLEQTGDEDAFSPVGPLPSWWSTIFSDPPATVIHLGKHSPFLEHFLDDARTAWSEGQDAIARSGLWAQLDSRMIPHHFEATAVTIGGKPFLLIEQVTERFEQSRGLLQRARDQRLNQQAVETVHRRTQASLAGQLAQTEQERDDILALLHHLDLAALLVDESGRLTYITPRGLQWLGPPAEPVIGRPWEQTLPITPSERKQIRHNAMLPVTQRPSRTIRFANLPARWITCDIHDDPRHSARRIVLLHDRTDVHHLRRQLDQKAHFHDLVGGSTAMLAVYQLVRDVARVDSTVLIEGETGTGKELIARALHYASGRKDRPFIAANCAGLTDSLLGSQLFGHKRGAFTGAIEDHRGLFEAADGGTLFLDEIGDVPHSVQTSLLRVLQEKEITRLGETKPRKVNVRVVAATHHSLSEDVIRGTFRADLLYRIRVARIQLPPLRDRRDDIPLLARTFLGQVAAATGKTIEGIAAESLQLLMTYSWPGNVRELKSAIEFGVISCPGPTLRPSDLPPEIRLPQNNHRHNVLCDESEQDPRIRITQALQQTGGNRSEAAKLLRMSRATFYRRLVDLKIESPIKPAR